MTTYVPPKKNTELIFYVSLLSQATPGVFQSSPTLAAGDVKVATDDGTPANITTLPVVDADFTKRIKITLSNTEMNGDNITIIFSDVAGDEWCDMNINIQTAARQIDDLAYPTTSGRSIDVSTTGEVEANLTQIDGLATSGNNATLNLKKLDIQNSAGTAFLAIGHGGFGMDVEGLGGAAGALFYSNESAGARIKGAESGLELFADVSGDALHAFALTEGDGAHFEGAGTGVSINAPMDITVSDGDLTLTAIAAAVWANATRTLTSFGTLIADIWTYITRTITGGTIDTNNDKTGYALTSAYDPAKTAAQAGDAMTLTATYDAAKTASQAGDAMTLTGDYDAAKTAAQVSDIPTASENATATLSAAGADPINSNIKQVNDTNITGTGTVGSDPWRKA